MFTRNTIMTVTALAALSASSALHAATIKVPQHEPTIQDAISAAGIGDKIVISEGIYYEDLTVTLKTDVIIKAKGDVIVDGGGADYAISVGLSTNVTVKGITFRNAALSLGRVFFGSYNRFEDCTFKGGEGYGVWLEGGASHEVVDSVFQNTEETGAMLESDSSYVAGNKFVNCGHTGSSAGIHMLGNYLTAESNQILDDGIGYGLRIGINGGSTHHALALGNEIDGAGVDGIYLDDALESLVMDNVITNSLDDGIDVQTGADGTTLDGNLVMATFDNGVEVSADQGTAFKNRVKKSDGSGVRVYASSAESFWYKNKVKKSGENGFFISGSDHAFTKNAAKGSVGVDLMDEAGVNANDYVDNVFETTGS